MTGALEINGKKMLTIKEAAKAVSYSRDHITKLAREGKIVATHIGRHWYVNLDSLKSYEETSKSEQEIRKRRLSEERRRDLQVKEILKQQDFHRRAKSVKSKKVATAIASIALVAGLLTGVGLYATVGSSAVSGNQQLASIGNAEQKSTESGEKVVSDVKLLEPQFESNSRLQTLSEANSGILLLPQTNEKSNVQFVEDYFSDPVKVVVNEKGETAIVMVDEEGNVISEPVPFVSVPVQRPNQ